MNEAAQPELKRQDSSSKKVRPTPGRALRNLKLKGFLFAVVGLIALGIAGWVMSQSFRQPEIDPELTAPIAIDRNPEPEDLLAGVPASAITRGVTQEKIDRAKHPLLPLLAVARKGLELMDENVFDYKCTIISQARVDGVLGDERYMRCKIRHQHETEEGVVPFSVYTFFLKPKNAAGQEAIWVEGRNKGRIIAHGPGMLNIKCLHLNPEGALAMKGNRYSMPNLGMKNLIRKMIEKGEQDLKYDECTATIKRGIEIAERTCSMMEIKHPYPRDHFEYHIARIYIDDQRNLPVAYEGYIWPEEPGGEPLLLEKYYYVDIETNVGLRNVDFSPRNKEYDFPRW